MATKKATRTPAEVLALPTPDPMPATATAEELELAATFRDGVMQTCRYLLDPLHVEGFNEAAQTLTDQLAAGGFKPTSS